MTFPKRRVWILTGIVLAALVALLVPNSNQPGTITIQASAAYEQASTTTPAVPVTTAAPATTAQPTTTVTTAGQTLQAAEDPGAVTHLEASAPAVRTSIPPGEPTTTTIPLIDNSDPECPYAGYIRANLPEYFVKLAKRESTCDPTQIGHRNGNGTLDWGLLQLNDVNIQLFCKANIACDGPTLLDPVINVRAARHLYDLCGFGPWSTNGYYCSKP